MTAYGSPTLEEFKQAIEQALALHDQRGIAGVLVDSTRRTGQPSEEQAAEGARFLAEKTRSKLSFAIVTRQSPEWHSDFSLKVGMGFGVVRYFSDKDEALAWLRSRGT